jgi:hypothetical protein
MFRPPYRPSSGCTLSYYKAKYTIYNVFVFVDEFSYTSVKFAFKIITVAVELKSYSNIKSISSIKFMCCDFGRGWGIGDVVKLGILRQAVWKHLLEI